MPWINPNVRFVASTGKSRPMLDRVVNAAAWGYIMAWVRVAEWTGTAMDAVTGVADRTMLRIFR